ncbi:class I SAM-dependent methyltransferase [Streptomyces armeniacus]|uniref:Class I SAM-dependent methyltransferase n=2 Tax=Streptomyces armeniacus TaxID=83291 RepID=A0A345Y191_9ACTN|nr:class I SAM-dependent methyltransferase [Streptomyces armeniacus]
MPVLQTALERLPVSGDVLELACGSGQWTQLLASRVRSLTAVDAAPEMLALARQRVPDRAVRFRQIDLFDWQPDRRYDTVFFAFWLTHVPMDRMPGFWSAVRAALRPGGRVVFLDDGSVKAQLEDATSAAGGAVVRRCLRDGSEHHAIKVFHTPDSLTALLAGFGWDASVGTIDQYHLSGVAAPSEVG